MTTEDVKESTEQTTSETEDDDLDALLAEGEEEKKPEPKAEPEKKPEVSRKEFDDLQRNLLQQKVEQGVGETIDRLTTEHEHLKGYPTEYVRYEWERIASRDPKIYEAFVNRQGNPDAWKKYEKAIAKEMVERIPAPKKEPEPERMKAARSASSGVSTSPPESDDKDKWKSQADLAAMSDAEYKEYRRSLS